MVVEKKGEYVKSFLQGRKMIIKSKRISKKKEIHSKRTTKKETHEKQMFKKENKKGECPQKNRIIHTKKEKLKKREKGRTCKNIQMCEDV